MYYKEIYQPRISDYDRNGKLYYESILQILETAGSHHSDTVGDSVIEGSQCGIAWILTEWRVQILRRTDSKEKLQITTWVRGKAPASTVFRDFILTDENGNEVIRAEAKFALLDLSAGRLTRISEELFASYQPEDKTVFDTAVPRLRAPTEFDSEQTITLRRSDIDFNGHVHNTRYVDLAMEALPNAIFASDDFSELHILYYKPVIEHSAVKAQYHFDGSSHLVTVYADNACCSLVKFK